MHGDELRHEAQRGEALQRKRNKQSIRCVATRGGATRCGARQSGAKRGEAGRSVVVRSVATRCGVTEMDKRSMRCVVTRGDAMRSAAQRRDASRHDVKLSKVYILPMAFYDAKPAIGAAVFGPESAKANQDAGGAKVGFKNIGGN